MAARGAYSSRMPADRPAGDHPGLARLQRRRRLLLPAMALGSVSLVPWALYLATTLTRRYNAQGWRGTWVGFDLALAAILALTAYLGWRRRIVLLVPAVAAGTMLLVDAWFDIMLSQPDDRLGALLSGLIEVPSGVILLLVATQQLRRLHRGLDSLGLTTWQVVERGITSAAAGPGRDAAPDQRSAGGDGGPAA